MSTAYWNQWIPAEKGVELSTYQDEYYDDRIAEGEPECCPGCMYCLGLSWKDFV